MCVHHVISWSSRSTGSTSGMTFHSSRPPCPCALDLKISYRETGSRHVRVRPKLTHTRHIRPISVESLDRDNKLQLRTSSDHPVQCVARCSQCFISKNLVDWSQWIYHGPRFIQQSPIDPHRPTVGLRWIWWSLLWNSCSLGEPSFEHLIHLLTAIVHPE